jgi:diketogulonate reductase-like aldo/keto reductase
LYVSNTREPRLIRAGWGDLCTGEIATQKGVWKQSWRVLEEKYRNGVVKSIGVSNFGMKQLEELWVSATSLPVL